MSAVNSDNKPGNVNIGQISEKKNSYAIQAGPSGARNVANQETENMFLGVLKGISNQLKQVQKTVDNDRQAVVKLTERSDNQDMALAALAEGSRKINNSTASKRVFSNAGVTNNKKLFDEHSTADALLIADIVATAPICRGQVNQSSIVSGPFGVSHVVDEGWADGEVSLGSNVILSPFSAGGEGASHLSGCILPKPNHSPVLILVFFLFKGNCHNR